MPDYPVFSPSQTGMFLDCPMLWWLNRRRGWQPKTFGMMEICGAIGTAFSVHQEHLIYEEAQAICAERAHDELALNLGNLHPRRCEGYAQTYLAKAHDTLDNYIQLYLEESPLSERWRLHTPELELTGWGRSRPDSLVDHGDGTTGVLDWKTKKKVAATSWNKILRGFEEGLQTYHYPVGLEEEHGISVSHVHYVVATLEPRREIRLHTIHVRPGMMENWLRDTRSAWKTMQLILDGELDPWRARVHEQYGYDCRMKSACFDSDCDEASMGFRYIQIER